MRVKRIYICLLLMAVMMLTPELSGDLYGQNRKRNKTEVKKTTATKKTTSAKSGKATSGKANPNVNVKPKTSAEAKKREAETRREIQLTEAQIRENEAKVSKSLAQLGKLDQEIGKTRKNISELDLKVKKLDEEINVLTKSINHNEADLAKLRGEYLKAVKKMRVTRKNKSDLAFIFASKSMSDAMRRMRYLREFSAWRSRQTEEINTKVTILKDQKESLAKAKEDQKAALTLQKSSEAKLAGQRLQQEALVAELKQNGKALESHLRKKQAEAKELGSMISQLIAREEEERRRAEEEERRRRVQEEKERRERELALAQTTISPDISTGKAEKGSKSKKEKAQKEKKGQSPALDKDKKPNEYADARKRTPRGKGADDKTGGFAGMRGRLPYPTNGSFQVTSRFGRQHLPDLPDVEFDNPGIDAETDNGASARAVYTGKVSGVYLLPGYNTVVIVNHGNYYTVYGNISSPTVKNGDTVEEGSLLGVLAKSDDNPDYSSIHFEVWKNREKLDPQAWLK